MCREPASKAAWSRNGFSQKHTLRLVPGAPWSAKYIPHFQCPDEPVHELRVFFVFAALMSWSSLPLRKNSGCESIFRHAPARFASTRSRPPHRQKTAGVAEDHLMPCFRGLRLGLPHPAGAFAWHPISTVLQGAPLPLELAPPLPALPALFYLRSVDRPASGELRHLTSLAPKPRSSAKARLPVPQIPLPAPCSQPDAFASDEAPRFSPNARRAPALASCARRWCLVRTDSAVGAPDSLRRETLYGRFFLQVVFARPRDLQVF